MEISANTIIVDSNPQTIWVDAAGQALNDIENLINAVDVIDSMPLKVICLGTGTLFFEFYIS